MIRLVIADDHTLFREGLRAILGAQAEIEIVGEASNGAQAVALAASELPDVILMDVQMPEMNGIVATEEILDSNPHIGIIVLTMLEDNDSVFAAMRAGARGYVLKGADKAEMLRAIHAVAQGEALFGPAIAKRLMNYFNEVHGMRNLAPPRAFPELTEREVEVLDLIARGYNNGEIAEKLVLSPKTVSNHISNIFSKLQVADRAQAIVRARQAGLDKERMQKDWSDTLTHWLAAAGSLEDEGQYNLAKYARASAEAVGRRAAYQQRIANDKDTLITHVTLVEQEMAALEVPAEIRAALGRGRAALESGKLSLHKDTPNPYVCRTCGQLVLDTPAENCSVCGASPGTFLLFMPNYWFNALDPFEALELMRRTPIVLANLLEELSEEQMNHPARDGGWSIHQAVTHFRDTQNVLAFRVNLMVEKDNPPLESLAIFEWAGKDQEKPATTREVFDAYLKSRQETTRTLENVPLKAWWRTGEHQEFGPMTLRQQVSYFISHEITHLPQIEALRT